MSTRKIDDGSEGAVPDDFSLPSSGIEETDETLFDLFDKKLSFQVSIQNQSTKVPVVFSTGERFALTRRKSPIRDKNNALILPIISIHRTGIDISPSQKGFGTPIAVRDQQSYIVKKRLSKKDRSYQNIVNKLGIKNQDSVASKGGFADSTVYPGNIAKSGRIASRRNEKNITLTNDPTGELLRNDVGNNIFEIITVPYPTFITLTYEVTFWTQYMQNMNQLLEILFAQFSGQDHAFKMTSKSGFEYVAYVDSQLSSNDNFSDFSQDERIIKYSFNITVPTYVFAPSHQGLSSPFKRFYSAPQFEFGYYQASTQVTTIDKSDEVVVDDNKFILSDVSNLNINGEEENIRGQGSERLVDTVTDPFTGKSETRLVKILTRNQRAGETVTSSRAIINLQTTLDSPSE
jgi:hypothetical protein